MSLSACASATASATTLEPEVKRQRTEIPDENDVPPLDDLLVALDVALRDEETETENVLLALIARAKLDSVAAREYLALALLIAFKRRNHAASQALGMGAGERKLLRTVLGAIAIHDPEAIKLVLPLVPLYGSWRDLLVLGEQLLPVEGDEAAAIAIEDIPIVDAICTLFAEQLSTDKAAEAELPSSAAKYAPHEGRHSGKGKNNARSKLLADAIATKLGLARPDADKHSLRAAYRKLRAALNNRLAEAGHLIEPLLAARRLDAIQFAKAPKGALAKCRKAIMANPKAAERWKRAMAKSTKAVPDLDDLVRAAAEALEEAEEPDASLRLLPRRLAKAIDAMAEQRATLVAKAESLLEQLQASSTSAETAAETAEATAEAPAAGAASAEGVAVAEAIAALADGATLPALPVVLSSDASGHVRHELLMAAFLLARAQALPYVAVDGELVDVADEASAPAPAAAALVDVSDVSAGAAAPPAALPAAPLPDWEGFLARVANVRPAIGARRGAAREETARLLAGGQAMLRSVATPGAAGGRGAGDVVVLCSALAAASADPEGLTKATNLLKSEGMRLLLVHRLRAPLTAYGGGAAAVPYVPRSLRPMPPRGAETIDVCFVLDLTGSMGQWIDQCKSHVKSIIHSLKDDLAVRTVRVAFCGYRDWGERNSPHASRVVTTDFVELAEVDTITRAIGREQASGGGDGPEDVIVAIEAVNRFTWCGDVRVCVFIADAPAHGYAPGRGGDDFPRGLCPDQHTPLPELIDRMAIGHGVDLLCTKLAGYTDDMFAMFRERYRQADTSGVGFGVLPIEDSAHKFKAAILGSLSTALCTLIAPATDLAGVQTFDGQTVSALTVTLSASLRESIDAAASVLRAPTAAAVEAAGAERDEVVAAAAERVEALEAEVAAAAAALDAADDDDDDGSMDAGSDDSEGPAKAAALLRAELEAAKGTLEAAKAKPTAARASRSDAARLRAALDAEELHPVRLALGLPLPTESLATEAASALLRAGVCVKELQDKGYPDMFVKAMREAAATLARRV